MSTAGGDEMPDAKQLQALHAAVEQAEYALAQVGEDLTFHVKPEGGLEVVRRGDGGLPVGDIVADLAGADTLLWQAARPEGDLTIGRGYGQSSPRCVLSGESLPTDAPVDLYYRGQPVAVDRAFEISPRLVYLRNVTYFADALLHELWSDMPRQGEVDPARKKARATAAVTALWFSLLGRLREAMGAGEVGLDEDAEPEDVPEEN